MSKKLLLACLPLLGLSIYYSLSAQVFSFVKNTASERAVEPENAGYTVFTWYQDLDGDGYGNAEVSTTTPTETAPEGYVANNTDCVDDNAAINPTSVWYKDFDDDFYSDGTSAVGCTPPQGIYRLATDLLGLTGDCNDEDPLLNPATVWYRDADFDGYTSAETITQCEKPFVGNVYRLSPGLGTDCNDDNANIYPGSDEICGNGIDDNCNGDIDEECSSYTWYQDADGDGYGNPNASTTTPTETVPSGYVSDGTDCDDTNAAINPTSIWYLDVDQDGDSYSPADAFTGCTPPAEGRWVLSTDTYLLGGGDCNDNEPYFYPGYWYLDLDQDRYGTGYSVYQCERPNIPSGEYWRRDYQLKDTVGDCNDEKYEVNPMAVEECGNGIDDDCNGQIDEDCGVEGDGDGDGTPDNEDCAPNDATKWRSAQMFKDGDRDGYYVSVGEVCYGAEVPEGYVLDGFGTDDCDDSNPDVYVSYPYYVDHDGDGLGSDQLEEVCVRFRENTPEGYSTESGDCDDNDPAVQYAFTFYVDADGDGYGKTGAWANLCAVDENTPPAGYALVDGDCDDTNPAAHPGSTEIVGNGVDDNCNGLIDEEGIVFTWYQDLDGDGFGNAEITIYTTTNTAPDGYVGNPDDCDDTQASINAATVWYKDMDGDLYSNGDTVIRCYPPAGYRGLTDYGPLSGLRGFGDCNDSNGAIYPGGIEICGNGIDDNCNGLVDEGCGDCGTPTGRLYVNAAVSTSGIGSGWNCAIKELRDAVDIANSTGTIREIWVAKGTYKPTAGTDRTAAITITNSSIQILGGFAGNETAASQANPVNNITIISGDIGMPGNIADNSYHLMRIPGLYSSSTQVIDGFSFENANANGPNPNTEDNSYGGALVIYNAKTTNRGVIIRPPNINLYIKRCLFKGNNAALAGGAVGINKFNQVYFDSCVFINNTSANGGAVATHDSYLNITNSLFSGNKANTGSGGAIYNVGNYIGLTKNTFDQNTAAINGGAYFQQLPEAGAAAGSAYFKQCVFSANSAAKGGAIYQVNAVWLNNCTFFGNTASVSGGAIEAAFSPNDNNTYVRNNIFWKNKKGSAVNVAGADIGFAGGVVPNNANPNIERNIFQVNTSVPADNGTYIISNLRGIDPMFVNEALPAGADGFYGYLNDGLELKNASPAKNIGNGGVGLEPADILGRTRIACGQVDLGAYENQSCATLIAKSDGAIKELVKKRLDANVTNPFRNQLLIRYSGGDKADVEISSLSGQKMWKGTAIQKGQTQVNTAGWPSGMYQVTIRTASSKPIIFKVVKAQ